MSAATNLPNIELTTLERWKAAAGGGCLSGAGGAAAEGCLVKVKAQVMTRDDSTGMWVPMSGGGMSVISLHRILAPTQHQLQQPQQHHPHPAKEDAASSSSDDVAYVILGQRIADKSMALHCELLSDLEYTSVNPTFHHWTTNQKRFGLTFQTSSDASAFQRNIDRLLVDQNMRRGPVDCKTQLHVTAEQILSVLQQVQMSAQTTVVDDDDDDDVTTPCPPSVARRPPTTTTRDSSSFNAPIAYDPPTPPTGRRPQCFTPRVEMRPDPTASPAPSTPTDQSTEAVVVVPPKAPPRFPIANTSSPPPPLSPPLDPSTGVTLGDYGYYVDVSPKTGVARTPRDIWIEESVAKDAIGRKVGLLALPSDEADDLIYFSGSYVHFARNVNSPETMHDYCYPSLDTFGTAPYGTTVVPTPGPLRPTTELRRAHLSTSVPVPLPIKTRRKWLRRKKSSPSTSKSSSSRLRSQGPKLRCVYCDEYFTCDDNRPGSCRDAPDRVLACIKAATCVCCQEAAAYHCHGGEEDAGGDPDDCDRLDCRGGERRRGGSGRRRAVLVLICLVVPCLWCYLPFRACHRLGVASGCCGPRHKAAASR